jgi:Zn-dependent protease
VSDDAGQNAGATTSPGAGPWGARDGSAPPPPPIDTARARPPNDPSLLWNVVSTALLAAFLAWRAGWMWALAAVIGVFVHEYGHVIAINLLGCGPGKIRIVPFVGGAAYPRVPPPTEFKGVVIALAGPVFGLLAAAPFFAAAYATGDGHWLEGAFVIGIINLLNLVPAPPLDGSKALGPALARLHPWVERGAIVLIGAAAIAWAAWRGYLILPVFLAIGVLGALRAGGLRPFALKLTGGEFVLSVLFYVIAVGLCLAVLWGVVAGLGLQDRPLDLVAGFLGAK